MRNRLYRFLWTLLAAIFLVEAWLWDVLGGAVAAFVAALPIEALRRTLRRLIDTLPAIFALTLFVIPVLVILPFKLVGLALIAKGRVALGAGVFLLAKTAGLGATAFVFDVCRERLLTLRWFARLYSIVIAFRDWAHARLDPYRAEIRTEVANLRERIRSRLAAGAPGLMRKVSMFRARIQARDRQPL